MSKNKVMVVLLVLLSIGIISLYSTYAYEENNSFINSSGISKPDYNLIYSIKNSSSKEISINPHEEKYVDVNLVNTYNSTIKYGMYYYALEPDKLPENVVIGLSEYSLDKVEDIIKPNNERSISIRINNNSEYSIKLIIGALVGFEKGNIEDLITDGEVLIK